MPFRIVGISIILHRILPHQMYITGYAMAYQMHPPVVEVHPPEANPSNASVKSCISTLGICLPCTDLICQFQIR